MTRVLQVMGRSAGGIARHVGDIVSNLDGSDGLTIDVVAPADLPIEIPKLRTHIDIPDGLSVGHLGAILALWRAAREYDVVHAHGIRAGVDAGIAARHARRVVTVHNLVQKEIAGAVAPLHRAGEGIPVAIGDRVFAVSEEIARRLRRAAPRHAERVEVLHLGVETPSLSGISPDQIRGRLGATDRHLIVTLARLAPQKALHVLLDAMEGVPGAVLAILGEGPLQDELAERARSRGIADRVHFLGFRADAADHVAAADVFCLSSIWEGVPLAAQEAIALGIPVVATDVGGMRELIANKISGRLVPPNDPEALAVALRETLGSPEDRDRFARGAKEHLDEEFSMPAMLERIKAAYVG